MTRPLNEPPTQHAVLSSRSPPPPPIPPGRPIPLFPPHDRRRVLTVHGRARGVEGEWWLRREDNDAIYDVVVRTKHQLVWHLVANILY